MKSWKRLKVNREVGYELWQTPVKFLVCMKYIGYFRFYNTLPDATKAFEEIVKSELESRHS